MNKLKGGYKYSFTQRPKQMVNGFNFQRQPVVKVVHIHIVHETLMEFIPKNVSRACISVKGLGPD